MKLRWPTPTLTTMIEVDAGPLNWGGAVSNVPTGTVTLLLVAHRIPTLAICDRILVLERGRVVAVGPHQELKEGNVFYNEALRLSQVL